MSRYIASRLVSAFVVVLIVSVITFFIINILPGDLASTRLGENATEADVRALNERLGLDEPLAVQYFSWLRGILEGNPGRSLTSDLSVAQQLWRRLPLTLELTVGATLVSLIAGVPLGVFSATRRGTSVDHGIRVLAVLGQAIPSFWVGTVALTLLSLYFAWVPSVTYRSVFSDPLANLEQLALPVLIAGYSQSAIVMRLTRSSMLDVLAQDYVRTARAKGLRSRAIIVRHALRNALIPIVTIVSSQIGVLIGGMILVETVFSLPGVGRLTFQAISEHDYPQLQFNVLVISTFVVLINLLVDLSYMYLDPRVSER